VFPHDKAQTPLVTAARRAADVLEGLLAQALPTGLYLVATPIGNLGDMTLRGLATLARADAVYCEDTRHSRTLLAHYSISQPLRPYHEHNAERERPRILAELAMGKSVALISDAGTPLVSDPGYKLVRACLDAGHPVTSLPGPSALLAALGSAGLATDTFLFAGFLPAKRGARRARLAEVLAVPATLVFFEAPSRLAESLGDMAAVMGPRQAAVARELTKIHEEFVRGTLPELHAEFAGRPSIKGEIVIVVEAAMTPSPPVAAVNETESSEEEVRRLQSEKGISLKQAVKEVAQRRKIGARQLYQNLIKH